MLPWCWLTRLSASDGLTCPRCALLVPACGGGPPCASLVLVVHATLSLVLMFWKHGLLKLSQLATHFCTAPCRGMKAIPSTFPSVLSLNLSVGPLSRAESSVGFCPFLGLGDGSGLKSTSHRIQVQFLIPILVGSPSQQLQMQEICGLLRHCLHTVHIHPHT